ncbi:hypothetical protein M0R19_08695 [Candidatus Pacearchaeota archaeon]|jgi:hypothetical protein|nr:hypothetical protein [bacterium]MCK9597236.1 hypothetical protein [Candidatus Pacearchaeota archaeon]
MYSRLFGDESVLMLDYIFDTNTPLITIAMKLESAQGNKGKYTKGQKVFDYEKGKTMKLSADECNTLELLLSSFINKQTVDYSKPVASREWNSDGANTLTSLFIASNKGYPVVLITTLNKTINQETKHYYTIKSKGDLMAILGYIKSTFTILPAMGCYHYWNTSWNKRNEKKQEEKGNQSSKKVDNVTADQGSGDFSFGNEPTKENNSSDQFDGIEMSGGVVLF